MIELALRARLLTAPRVTALVGEGDDARIYPLELPQAPGLPAITFQRISGDRVRTTLGPEGLTFGRVQFDCWATSYAAAAELANEIRRVLDGWRGIGHGIVVQSVEISGDRDDRYADLKLWRRSFDAEAWYREV